MKHPTPAHVESLPDTTKRALFLAGKIAAQEEFRLAGGTALALWLGHRISADLDFFSENPFSTARILDALAREGTFRLERREPDTILGEFNGVKTSFFRYPYPWIELPASVDDIRVASVVDIACMKLDAVASRGAKRDFVDVYCVAQNNIALPQLVEAYQKKYARLNVNPLHLLKGLVYFADAEQEPMPRMREPVAWEEVKAFFIEETRKLASFVEK